MKCLKVFSQKEKSKATDGFVALITIFLSITRGKLDKQPVQK